MINAMSEAKQIYQDIKRRKNAKKNERKQMWQKENKVSL
jgi:hypothetical protein